MERDAVDLDQDVVDAPRQSCASDRRAKKIRRTLHVRGVLVRVATSTKSPSGSGTVLPTRTNLSRSSVPAGIWFKLGFCAHDEKAAIAIGAMDASARAFLILPSRIPILNAIHTS